MISNHYTSGPNIDTAGSIIGRYWSLVLQSPKLLEAVCRIQGNALDYNEALERGLIAWLDEQKAGYLGRTLRVADIPPTDITLKKAVIGEALSIGGGGFSIGQPSSRVTWVLKLPFFLSECPYIGITPDTPLLIEGIDYTSDGKNTLYFNRNPYQIAFQRVLKQDSDGQPVFALQMAFLACVPRGYTKGYIERYGRYRVSPEARHAVFSLLVEESSVLRILKAAMAAAGAVIPSIFEETDEIGSFTWIRRIKTEGTNTLLLTSGGELAIIPTSLGIHVPEEGWKHRPADSLCTAISLTDGKLPVLNVSQPAIAASGGNLGVFQAIRDSLPAGNALRIAFSATTQDAVTLNIAEQVGAFIVYQGTETLTMQYDDVIRFRSHL